MDTIEIAGVQASLYNRGKRVLWTDSAVGRAHFTGSPTDTYHPLSHVEVLESLMCQIQKTDMEITDVRLSIGRGKKNMAVARVVVRADNGLYHHQYTMANGHNGQVPVVVAPGFEVIACTNGCIVAVRSVKARHTKNVRVTMESRFKQIIAHDLEQRNVQADKVDRMRTTPVTLDQAKVLIMTSAYHGYVVKPLAVFKEFVRADDLTVWGLWMAVTYNEELCSRTYIDRAPKQMVLLEDLIA